MDDEQARAMLEALKAIVRWYDETRAKGYGYSPIVEVAQARKAIAGAEAQVGTSKVIT